MCRECVELDWSQAKDKADKVTPQEGIVTNRARPQQPIYSVFGHMMELEIDFSHGHCSCHHISIEAMDIWPRWGENWASECSSITLV